MAPALGYALLWGLAFEVLESFVLPLGDLSWRELLAFALRTSNIWLVCTFGMACLAMFAEPRMGIVQLGLFTGPSHWSSPPSALLAAS